MSMRFGPAMPALHVVSDAGRGVSGGSRGGWVGEKAGGGPRRASDGGIPGTPQRCLTSVLAYSSFR